MPNELYVGVMSGTSMDGVDAVLVQFTEQQTSVLAHHSEPIPTALRETCLALCSSGTDEIERSAIADIKFGKLIAKSVNALLDKSGFKAADIRAIGSHGQTLRHRPDTPFPFSLQIGNPNIIAQDTEITTVADFRMADIAAGGQGAPLVPAFHQAVFGATNIGGRIVINIGGIANLTHLPKEKNDAVLGHDIGPGNTLLDQWVAKYKAKPYDINGEWARSGVVSAPLLVRLQQDPFILKPAPKSTGREYFNIQWLESHLNKLSEKISTVDVQRTLTEFSAAIISDAITSMSTTNHPDIFFCGGGVNNTFLMERIQALSPDAELKLSDELGIPSQQVEAAAFAWLAQRTLNHLPGNIKSVTGARQAKILGGIYLP